MTTFEIGDRIRSGVTAQGMVKDHEYVIVGTSETLFLGSTYVTYRVSDDNRENAKVMSVANLHLIAKKI